jgi:hypothetical protein
MKSVTNAIANIDTKRSAVAYELIKNKIMVFNFNYHRKDARL